MENIKCSPVSTVVSRWIPLIFYAGFVFYLSSLSHPSVPQFPYSDKFYHAVLYAGFGLLLVRAFSARKSGWSRARILEVAVLGTILYGFTDEWHQTHVAGRSAEWADLASDGIGGLLGGGLYILISYVEKLHRKKIQRNGQAVAPL